MKLQDLFEGNIPEAHSIEEFARLAVDYNRVEFEGQIWEGHKLKDKHGLGFITWSPRGKFSKLGTWISFDVNDNKAFYVTKAINWKKTHYILDPEKFIKINMRLNYNAPKKHFLHELLRQFKGELDALDDEDHSRYIRELIKASRMLGNDYPEFKAIEKSLG